MTTERIIGTYPCGFCQTGSHEKCCSDGGGVIQKGASGKDWICPCSASGHGRL